VIGFDIGSTTVKTVKNSIAVLVRAKSASSPAVSEFLSFLSFIDGKLFDFSPWREEPSIS